MFAVKDPLQSTMEEMISREIQRLINQADACIFVLYDPDDKDMDPRDYLCIEKKNNETISYKASLDFEGVGVWYLIFRIKDKFSAKKILIRKKDGLMVHGQMGNFEGYWQDFPRYVVEDRWVQSYLMNEAVNDDAFNGLAMRENLSATQPHTELEETSDLDISSYEDEYYEEEYFEEEEVEYYWDDQLDDAEIEEVEGSAVDIPEVKHWYEPPEEKRPEPSIFVQDDEISKDLADLYETDELIVDEFPDRPFSRYS